MSTIDDFCEQMRALCLKHEVRAVELYVNADGRVQLYSLNEIGFSLGTIQADIREGSSLPLPSVALSRWSVKSGRKA